MTETPLPAAAEPRRARNAFTAVLTLLLTFGFFAFVAALLVLEVPATNKDILLIAAGVLFTGTTGAWGFFFGSSDGSKTKEAALVQTKTAVA